MAGVSGSRVEQRKRSSQRAGSVQWSARYKSHWANVSSEQGSGRARAAASPAQGHGPLPPHYLVVGPRIKLHGGRRHGA